MVTSQTPATESYSEPLQSTLPITEYCSYTEHRASLMNVYSERSKQSFENSDTIKA